MLFIIIGPCSVINCCIFSVQIPDSAVIILYQLKMQTIPLIISRNLPSESPLLVLRNMACELAECFSRDLITRARP
jgi:hypothetical protein